LRAAVTFLFLISGCFFSAFETPAKRSNLSSFGGETHTYVYSEPDGTPLLLDLRVPAKPRWDLPGILFVHGGGFADGTRDSAPVVGFLEALSELGIVSASISYRLTQKGRGFGCDIPVEEKRSAVRTAGDDLMAARRWLRGQALRLPDRWVAAGSSAGAETALWTGFVASPDMWAGIISFSGALEAGLSLPESPPPLLAFHGACDNVVPSGRAIHRRCSPSDTGAWDLCGGTCLVDRLQEQNVPARLWLDCTGGHEVCNRAMLRADVHAIIADWLMEPEATGPSVVLEGDGALHPYTASSCAHPCNGMD